MTTIHRKFLGCALGFVLATFCFLAAPSQAQDTSEGSQEATQAAQQGAQSEEQPAESQPGEGMDEAAASPTAPYVGKDNKIFSMGGDSRLREGQDARSVVTLFGDSIIEGNVEETAVTVFGSTVVTDRVAQKTVTVMGNAIIDGAVGNVVVVMGQLWLGRNAQVYGDVLVVGGKVARDETAVVHRQITQISLGADKWLVPVTTWVWECLFYGRPLAMEPGLTWAWIIALGMLLVCMLFATNRGEMDEFLHTLETQPRFSILAALFTLILMPLLYVLLCFTGSGMMLIPLLWLFVFLAGLMGKTIILAAIGRRLLRRVKTGPFSHPVFAVLVGALVVLPSLVVPVLGFIVYKLLGTLGIGVIIYNAILQARADVHKLQRAAAETAASKTDAAPASPMPADFWLRMVALGIDVILVAALLVCTSLVKYPQAWLLLLAAYGAVMWKLKGNTIGGIVMDLKVVQVDGRSIDWSTAVVRALGCFLSLIAAGLGFLWIIFDKDKQAWHDKIAGTVVLWTPRRGGFFLGSTKTTQDPS